MNELIASSAAFGVVISLAAYLLCMYVRDRLKLPVLNPLLFSIIIIIVFLLVCRIDVENYTASAKYLTYLVTPATVALAIPLYRQFEALRNHPAAILIGCLAGVMTSAVSILIFALLFRISHGQYVTMLPKSITTAIGMGMSEEFGGYPSITVASIIITGVLGNVFAEGALKLMHITDPIAKGIAIGASAHAIGTTKALELGEVEGAMSSLAIVVCGLMTVVVASVFAMIY